MEWLSYLLLILCPLMMIVSMKGHGGKHNDHDKHQTETDIQRS